MFAVCRSGRFAVRALKSTSSLGRNVATFRYSYNFQPYGVLNIRCFSTNEEKSQENKTESENNKQTENDSGDSSEKPQEPESSNSNASGPSFGRFSLRNSFSFLVDNFKMGIDDLMGKDRQSTLSRQVVQAESYSRKKTEEGQEDDEEYEGTTAMVLVKDSQSTWDQMKARLEASPFFRDILKKSRTIGAHAADTDVGKKMQDIGESVRDKIFDARETWETSQNPLIYTLSGVWDSVTQDTEEALAIAKFQKLDPNFVKEDFLRELETDLIPQIIRSHMLGDIKTLKPWLNEPTYRKLSAEIMTRKHDGITVDPTILDVAENRAIFKVLEDGRAFAIVIYAVQQINCIRNREGEIIEGSESTINGNFYSVGLEQVYDEDEEVVRWKIVEYEFVGGTPYFF